MIYDKMHLKLYLKENTFLQKKKIQCVGARVSIQLHAIQHTQRTYKESKVRFILILTLSENTRANK